MIKKILRTLKNKISKLFFRIITKISPKLATKILFVIRTGKKPNLKNPKTFNEKTTVLKLDYFNKNQKFANLADKYEVRKYIENKGLSNILNELYAVYDNANEIDFDKLPNQFVIKCTHGCGFNIICRDKSKLDINKTKEQLNRWMKQKYGYETQELHYTKIKPRIIIEKYLGDQTNKMLIDYKIYCFNGVPKCILVCSEREKKLKLSYYDLKWNRIDYEDKNWSSKENIKKPKNLDKMIEYAAILSKDIKYVRVDFYDFDGVIIFGELTFTPACCCAPYYSDRGDIELGELLSM